MTSLRAREPRSCDHLAGARAMSGAAHQEPGRQRRSCLIGTETTGMKLLLPETRTRAKRGRKIPYLLPTPILQSFISVSCWPNRPTKAKR